MVSSPLREAYLRWLRGALLALMLPLVLVGLVQWASSSAWWTSGPPGPGAARYLFIAVGAAAVVAGRDSRSRETASAPLDPPALRSLSWRLVTYALVPVATGAVLVFMTRQILDFHVMLIVTLVGTAVLFPRYDQWVRWSASGPEDS